MFWKKRPKRRTILVERVNLIGLAFQFLLTTVLGSAFFAIYQEETERRAYVESSFEVVEEFLRTAAVRRERSDLVYSSIRRGAALEELILRKTNYDEAYIAYNAVAPRAETGLQGGFGSSRETLFECAINRYLSRWNALLDGCLTRGYDAALKARADADKRWGGLSFPEGDAYPEEALGHLAACRRTPPTEAEPEGEPYRYATFSRAQQNCANAIDAALTEERIRARRLLANSHDALWGDDNTSYVAQLSAAVWPTPTDHLERLGRRLDQECKLKDLRRLYPKPTDPSRPWRYEGGVVQWCRGVRAAETP